MLTVSQIKRAYAMKAGLGLVPGPVPPDWLEAAPMSESNPVTAKSIRANCREIAASHPQLTRGPWAAVFVRHDFSIAAIDVALAALRGARGAIGLSERARTAALAGEAFLIGLRGIPEETRCGHG